MPRQPGTFAEIRATGTVRRRNAPRDPARPIPVLGSVLAMIGLAGGVAIVAWLFIGSPA
jgi:hypothetical protein